MLAEFYPLHNLYRYKHKDCSNMHTTKILIYAFKRIIELHYDYFCIK